MAINKRILTLLTLIIAACAGYADNGINSPYSRYGLGILADQSLGVNRQMSGLGYAINSGSYINLLNPASFAKADTLTMLLETGFSMQNVNFKEGKVQRNARNASFDYIAMQFRLCPNLGMSAGFLPFSNVGYSFSTATNDGGFESTQTYNGEGGIYQPFVGIGWQPFKNLSVGVMGSYIYGDIQHTIANDFSQSTITDNVKKYSVNVKSYKVDFGAQYTAKFNNKHSATFGAVYTLGHNIDADISITEQDASKKIESGLKIPHTFGAGFWYNYNDKWKVGADYTMQKWSGATFTVGDKGIDRSKISVGAEYYPNNIMSRNLLKKIHYRVGAYYAQPYTEIKAGNEGCEEYGVSAGFSLPITNNINNRSMLHISGQLVRMEPKSGNLISETYMRLNIGITFNESWFMKLRLR